VPVRRFLPAVPRERHKNTLKNPDGDVMNGNSTAADPTRRGLFARGLGM
jgi:hypothetical protein